MGHTKPYRRLPNLDLGDATDGYSKDDCESVRPVHLQDEQGVLFPKPTNNLTYFFNPHGHSKKQELFQKSHAAFAELFLLPNPLAHPRGRSILAPETDRTDISC
jgi:hypothetical protein